MKTIVFAAAASFAVGCVGPFGANAMPASSSGVRLANEATVNSALVHCRPYRHWHPWGYGSGCHGGGVSVEIERGHRGRIGVEERERSHRGSVGVEERERSSIRSRTTTRGETSVRGSTGTKTETETKSGSGSSGRATTKSGTSTGGDGSDGSIGGRTGGSSGGTSGGPGQKQQ
jgi:hypothetical protein